MNVRAVGPETYREILRMTRRFARSDDEARDWAQDVVEIALRRGVQDWSSPERRAWLRGVARNHAAFAVRTQKRRRQRERSAELEPATDGVAVTAWAWQPAFLASLPRSLRLVANLASTDLGATEIRWLLRLTDTALRQRLSALRRALRAHDDPPTLPALPPPRSFGGQRAQLVRQLRKAVGRTIATSDPDGHVILLKVDPHKRRRDGN